MGTPEALTPMMRQYRRIKSEIEADTILLFRLGDFYELFFEDAQRAAPILGVTLTRRNGYPMCGVPYHALDSYLAKLVRANCKVALCEQVEDPATAKGIVRRELTRVITPGTVTEDEVLAADEPAYLAALHAVEGPSGPVLGLALLDLSVGQLLVEEHASDASLRDSLQRTRPRECLLGADEETGDAKDADPRLRGLATECGIGCLTAIEAWRFEPDMARDTLTRHFGVPSLDGFGCEDCVAAVGAAGALLQHVRDTLRRPVGHVRTLRRTPTHGWLHLDEATRAHLDLFSEHRRDPPVSVFGVLDATCTPMGARRLRRWLAQPLAEIEAIGRRHEAVERLTRERAMLASLRSGLSEIRDLERLIGRIALGRGNARDLNAVARALEQVPALRTALAEGAGVAEIDARVAKLRPLPELVARIRRTLTDDPPAAVNAGGIIRADVSAELDELRGLAADGRAWVARYQAQESERTGIKNLKVRHNKVFGYFIEVSLAQADRVPAEYQRKQTMVGGERYVTPELKRYEEQILGAHERAVALEAQMLDALRSAVMEETVALQELADALADLDVLGSLADRALALGYVRPVMGEDLRLEIVEGRHPVIEQLPDAERFVPNDVRLDGGSQQILVITGPNMAGKSTFIRQVAVLVVMAQMGSFVPARAATIGWVDRVFTRVGASDDLARGRSTFMVEMQETANILNNATARSLVVLDEIGRGTSTFDGISIAWAVAEQLHNQPAIKARTLFATHYHELTDLALTLEGVKNYSVLVREQQGRIAFLRRIVPGAADKSYGIAVAQLAGMPPAVIERAREILANLEEGELADTGLPTLARSRPRGGRRASVNEDNQLLLFD